MLCCSLPTSNHCAGVNIKYPFSLDQVHMVQLWSYLTFFPPSLSILIADGGIVLFNVPLGSHPKGTLNKNVQLIQSRLWYWFELFQERHFLILKLLTFPT